MSPAKKQYWLMKSEPDVYSIDDLEHEGKTQWEGIRNYQARNFMRDTMNIGDDVLFYHSNTKPPGIVGLGRICSEPYPDYFAFDKKSNYYDAKSDPDNPRWMMVDVEFVEKFSGILSLDEIKEHPKMQEMLVIQRGQRLSIQPVSAKDFKAVCQAVKKKG